MGNFEGKVVIVTGAALGMGGDTATAFAAEGASVVIADINGELGSRRVSDIEAAGGSALCVEVDVAVAADARSVVESAVAEFGGVDVLFNNVGIQPVDSYLNVEDTTEEMWDHIVGVNLKSYFLMAKYAIPEIRRRGGGAIINNASVQGLQSQYGVPAYAASKGGVPLADPPDGAGLRL